MNYGRKSKKLTGESHAKRILQILLRVIVFLICAHLFLQFLNLNVFHQQNGQFYELSNRFDFDDEASVPTWFSQALFLTIGVLAMLAAYVQTNKSARRLWGIIAASGLLVSVDEISGLHEYALQSLHNIFFQDIAPTGFANAWLLITPFVIAVLGWLGWSVLRLLPRRTSLLFITAGVAFVTGAMILDLVISVAPRENFLNQGVLVALEETLELLGTVIGLYAIADYLETYYNISLRQAFKKLKAAD